MTAAAAAQLQAWCPVDRCPTEICHGPHSECTGPGHPGMIVVLREDQHCIICGDPARPAAASR